MIRVALATNVRSATISSTGRLLNGNDEGENFAPLEVTRLRLEPRLLSPPPQSTRRMLRGFNLRAWPAAKTLSKKQRMSVKQLPKIRR
jgi:hypothetical protein